MSQDMSEASLLFLIRYILNAENLPNVCIRNWKIHCQQKFWKHAGNQFDQIHVIATKVVQEQCS